MIKTAFAQELEGGCVETAPEFGLEMARADAERPCNIGNAHGFANFGAKDLAGALNMVHSQIRTATCLVVGEAGASMATRP